MASNVNVNNNATLQLQGSIAMSPSGNAAPDR